jgi:hypothetical protein
MEEPSWVFLAEKRRIPPEAQPQRVRDRLKNRARHQKLDESQDEALRRLALKRRK